MVEDVVRELGHLTLGTRLKRIGERLQAHTQRILDSQELSIAAGQCPFMAALDRLGPLTIGELADAVGITQPGATRMAAQLAALELVAITQGKDDQRRRLVTLSAEGKRLVALCKRGVWPAVEGAVKDACRELEGPLLAQLSALEQALSEESLDRRARRLGAKTPRAGQRR